MRIDLHKKAQSQPRRKVITRGVQLAFSGLAGLLYVTKSIAKNDRTPSQTEGPFYPLEDQKDKDLDLTRIKGHSERATGQLIEISGTIMDMDNNPIPSAVIEIWQANHWGKYAHRRDPNTAPLDPNFQGWGITTSLIDGSYTFKTIMPGSYPASFDWTRPPHIHYKILKSGQVALTTQMYFPGQKLNESDQILQAIPKNEQHLVIAELQNDTTKTRKDELLFRFNIILR